MNTITVGGITVVDPIHTRSDVVFFTGAIEDMPFFTNYLRVIQQFLQEEGKPLLTTIKAIRYMDKYDPRRLLTIWIAYSDDLSVGWYKYAGLVAGGTRHRLLYDGSYQHLPPRATFARRK